MRKRTHVTRPLTVLALALAGAGLTGCGDDNNDRADTAEYAVTVTNLTHGQPLTPPAVVIHRTGYAGWTEGAAAGSGLEELAEGGATDAFLATARGDDAVITAAAADGGAGPGDDRSLTLEVTAGSGLHLTLATMLAATNDGFTGVKAHSLDGLRVGDSERLLTRAWDAGTEANTESAATVPALGGEGFNTARSSRVDRVTIHPGVVTAADGLAGSGLTEAHRFQRPVAQVTVTRVK
jgi:hypothetical protein